MMKKTITVLGVTGMQGGSVAGRFLSRPDWHVRGLTRNSDSAKAHYWAGRGVEVVEGDYDDVDSLRVAFKGSHAIFAVTDWAANYARVGQDGALQERARAAWRSFEQFAGDLEEAQGINMAVAALDPVVLSTLERFVFSTLPAVRLISGGKYKHSYEFDSKAGAERYMRNHLSAVLSTVTLGIFQETWRDIGAFRPHKQPDGTFVYVNLKVSGPHDANPAVVASRDTGAFVEALILHQPPGTDILGATEIISRRDFAALWGRTLGVHTTVRDVSEEEFVRYVPDAYKTTLVDDLRFCAEFGYTGGNPKVKTPAELGVKTSSLVEYFRNEDWSEVLDGRL